MGGRGRQLGAPLSWRSPGSATCTQQAGLPPRGSKLIGCSLSRTQGGSSPPPGARGEAISRGSRLGESLLRASVAHLPGKTLGQAGEEASTCPLPPGQAHSRAPPQVGEVTPGDPGRKAGQHSMSFLSDPLDSKQNGDANAMLSDEEGAGLTQPLASAPTPTPEERRALRRSGTRDRNKKAAACFLLSAGDYACADGSVRKGMAPRLGRWGAPSVPHKT